jgi:hypothetical protein
MTQLLNLGWFNVFMARSSPFVSAMCLWFSLGNRELGRGSCNKYERLLAFIPVSWWIVMIMNGTDSIPTRQSLLARLKDWGDQESWREFFDTYWRLIHATALKAGLNEAEAQEVMLAAALKTGSWRCKMACKAK